MRVLLTTDTVGGVWTYSKELTEGLLRHGCSIALVSFGQPPSDEQIAWAQAMSDAYKGFFRYDASSIPLEWMEANDRSFREGAALLSDIAGVFKPDLLHSNQFCFGCLPLEIPRLVVAHSDVFTWGEACKPGGFESNSWLDRYTHLIQAGLLGANAIVAPTYWMLEALDRHCDLPSCSQVIANGRSLPRQISTHKRSVQAVSAGRLWDPSKNLGVLKSMRNTLPILIAGSFLESELLDDDCGVVLLGFRSERDLLRLFQESRIYVAASIYEPFGLAPLEAALCGCAIVANDLQSFREVWGDAALYFRDAFELNQLLVELAGNEALLSERQRLSKMRAEQFSSEAMTLKYLALYGDLLAGSLTHHAAKAGSLTYVS